MSTTPARIDMPLMVQGVEWVKQLSFSNPDGTAQDLSGRTLRMQLLSNDQPGADFDELTSEPGGQIEIVGNVATITVTSQQTADFVPRGVQGSTQQGLPIGFIPYTLVWLNADASQDPVATGRIPVVRGLDVATGNFTP